MVAYFSVSPWEIDTMVIMCLLSASRDGKPSLCGGLGLSHFPLYLKHAGLGGGKRHTRCLHGEPSQELF